MRWGFLLLLVWSSVALSGPAQASTVTNPDWRQRPSPDDISRYYPDRAQRQNVDGTVRVQCRLSSDGVLGDCIVLSETPTGYGFGEAALNVAARFQMRPGTRDGRPVSSQVIIPISFSLPAPEPAASPPRPGNAGAGSVVGDILAPLAPFLFLALWLGWIGWIVFFSPDSDPLRLKRDYAPPLTVKTVRRIGTIPGGRWSPWYRVYAVTLEQPGQPTRTLRLGVKVSLFGEAEVKDYTSASSFVLPAPPRTWTGDLAHSDRPGAGSTPPPSQGLRRPTSAPFATDLISGRPGLIGAGPVQAPDRRSAGLGNPVIRVGLVLAGIFGLLLFMALLDLGDVGPAGSALAQAYAPRHAELMSFKSPHRGTDCGVYAVRGEPRSWRYLRTPNGLWAEGLSPDGRGQQDPLWRGCMDGHGGGALDGLILPVVLWLANQS